MITFFVELIVLREDGYLPMCIKMLDNRLIHNIHKLKGLFFVLLNSLFLIMYSPKYVPYETVCQGRNEKASTELFINRDSSTPQCVKADYRSLHSSS